jgi:hypothetical protein
MGRRVVALSDVAAGNDECPWNSSIRIANPSAYDSAPTGNVTRVAQAKHTPRSGGDARSRVEFETLISDLSSRFINLPPSEVDGTIKNGPRRVCEFLAIDNAFLWQWSVATPDVLTPTHSYPAQNGPRPRDPIRQEQYPWIVRQMLAGNRSTRYQRQRRTPVAVAPRRNEGEIE